MFKKNTAVTGFTFGLVSATDGSDITTGTPVGYYTLDGGSQTAIGDVTPVHEGNGQWSFDLLAAEMNGDVVGLTFTHASAITVHFTIKTDTKIVSELQDIAAGAQMDLVADAVDSTSVATGAITAAKLAAGAIDAAALATDAVDEIVDQVWDELLTGTSHNDATSAGQRLRQSQDAIGILNEGVAQAGAAGQITLAAAAEATEDEMYHDAYISLVGGTGAGQVRTINGYTASSRVATVNPNWAVNPGVDTEYVVAGSSQADLHSINESLTAAVNLALACDNYSVTRGLTGTAVPAVAADGVGGLPISDAGGLDLDNDTLTQVNAALNTAIAELGAGTPATTPTIRTALMLLYMAVANKRDTIAAQDEIHNAAGTVIADAVLSDDTVTFSKARYVAP